MTREEFAETIMYVIDRLITAHFMSPKLMLKIKNECKTEILSLIEALHMKEV